MQALIPTALEDLFGAHDEYEEAVKELQSIQDELGDLGLLRKKRRVARAIRSYVKRKQDAALAKVQSFAAPRMCVLSLSAALLQFIDKQRLRAHLAERNRPWDGIDGHEFKLWKEALQVVQLEDETEQIVTPYMRAMEEMEDEDELPLTRMEERMVAMKRGCGVVLGRFKEAMGF